jgi:hypothetical protein
MPPRPDVAHPSIRVQIAGRVFELHQAEVARLVGHLEPAEIRDHFVEIRGRRYPVKQALGAATGLDPSDFTSQHARSALRRLGLPVGRLSSAHSARTAAYGGATSTSRQVEQSYHVEQAHHVELPGSGPPTAGDKLADSADLAQALVSYRNRWVAIQRNNVLTDQDSFSETVAWLRAHHVKADAVFLVPQDPARLLAGLAT